MPESVQKFGIIGGGQLARMLVSKAQQIGMQAHVLSAQQDDPAAQVTRYWHQGDANDVATLKSFLEKVDVATFESEFLDVEKVKLASQFAKKDLYPSPQVMGLLQDRKTQKKLLDDSKIATAPWIFVEHKFQAKEVLRTLGQEMILKKCRFGYDGYGTFKVKSPSQLNEIFESPDSYGYIAEAKIKFKRELAFMMIRDRSGNTLSLPLVESFQENSKCLWVRGPIRHKRFRKLETQMKNLLKKINYVGAMGIELFDNDDELLVNELAPRVHNSAHYSMDALTHDQFLLHVMAVAGLRIPKSNTQQTKAFAMYNLIGKNLNQNLVQKDLFYHWYGKQEVRPGRKMGHVNALGSTPELTLQKIIKGIK